MRLYQPFAQGCKAIGRRSLAESGIYALFTRDLLAAQFVASVSVGAPVQYLTSRARAEL